MEFVNSIAHIVHQEVSLHGGAANKNIGDAFLLVWVQVSRCLPRLHCVPHPAGVSTVPPSNGLSAGCAARILNPSRRTATRRRRRPKGLRSSKRRAAAAASPSPLSRRGSKV